MHNSFVSNKLLWYQFPSTQYILKTSSVSVCCTVSDLVELSLFESTNKSTSFLNS